MTDFATDDDVFSLILTQVRSLIPADRNDFAAESRILDAGLLDSLGIINLVGWIEEKFGIEIPENEFDMGNFQTVRSITEMIKRIRSE